MTPEFKAAWVAALRSGKYEQGRGVMRKGDRFCCLGVACDLIDPGAWGDGRFGMGWNGSESPDLPFINTNEFVNLVVLNDDGSSFEKIADYIEHNIRAEDLT